jgi:hypothetical protein
MTMIGLQRVQTSVLIGITTYAFVQSRKILGKLPDLGKFRADVGNCGLKHVALNVR